MTPQGVGLDQSRVFTCQQSGHCCRDPKLIVTLTHRDMYLLYVAIEQEFQFLLKKIAFYTLEDIWDEKIRERLVLHPIQTSRGLVIPGLRKHSGGECVFYVEPDCGIYQYRPLACRLYPFAFRKSEDSNAPITVWTKNATKTCRGIGRGGLTLDSELHEMGQRYFEEVRKHNDMVKNLNLEATQDIPLTARESVWVSIVYAQAEVKKEREETPSVFHDTVRL